MYYRLVNINIITTQQVSILILILEKTKTKYVYHVIIFSNL